MYLQKAWVCKWISPRPNIDSQQEKSQSLPIWFIKALKCSVEQKK